MQPRPAEHMLMSCDAHTRATVSPMAACGFMPSSPQGNTRGSSGNTNGSSKG